MKKKSILLIALFILIGIGIAFASIKNLNKTTKHNNIYSMPQKEVLLMLINYQNETPKNYKPELTEYDGYKFSVYLEKDFKEMINDAKEHGYNVEISSAYRSKSQQKKIYDDKYNSYVEMGMNSKDAKYLTEKEVAVPGYSEHESGLALDLTTMGDLNEKEKAWDYLKRNSYKFGFINRYPEDKTDITKIESEPWHFRYVGKKYAKQIFDEHFCLEEYLKK